MKDADRRIAIQLAANSDGTQKPLCVLVHDFTNHKGKLSGSASNPEAAHPGTALSLCTT